MHAQTQTGDTALTYTCENGHMEVAEVLLDNGAELVSAHYLSIFQKYNQALMKSANFGLR